MVGEVWAFALASVLTPMPPVFFVMNVTKEVAGKGCWKLLKTKGDEMRPTARNRTAGRSGEGKFEASQPGIA
jgi:hypothetical protein